MNRYAVFDLETSGLPKYNLPAEHPDQPHVASFAMILTTEGDDGVFVIEDEFYSLVKSDGWQIEPGAAAVNKLTLEMLEADGRPIVEITERYAAAIDDARIIVSFNTRFDCKIMRGEMRRLGMDDRFDVTPNYCTMRGAQEVMKLCPTDAMMASGRKTNKPPKLIEAYEYFTGHPFNEQHHALEDARGALEVLKGLRQRGVDCSGEVHYAKEGTAAGEALAKRQERE